MNSVLSVSISSTVQVADADTVVVGDDVVAALDRRLQQLSVSNANITPHKNIHLLDQLTAQQEKNQLALMQLQQQMHVLNTSRCV